jgi:hypothetical protein
MSSKSDWPQFRPEDAEGFRSFSLYTDTQEHIRVSVRFSALKEYADRTASDFDQYSPLEQESLKAAAALLAAKVPGNINSDELSRAETAKLALKNLLEGSARFTTLAFEKWFPGLAAIALQVAADACVKKTLNNVAQSFNVPIVTTEKALASSFAISIGRLKCFCAKKGDDLKRRNYCKICRQP